MLSVPLKHWLKQSHTVKLTAKDKSSSDVSGHLHKRPNNDRIRIEAL